MDNPNGSYVVLRNKDGQYSLWPSFLDIPDGWNVIFGEDNRDNCMNYIEANWKDLLPSSLILVNE